MRASEALALGALDAGVAFVTGYPGSPSTAVVEALLRLADEQVHIEWATNERSAFDAAFGASVGGMRSLVCLKSVGLNVALDSLMVSNLAGGDGGFVVLVGDDPGAWSSQNEQDSRLLVAAAEVPLLEPTVAQECRAMMVAAFALSEQVRTPVVVRITAALAASETAPVPTAAMAPVSPPPFRRQPGRWVVLPASVVAYHRALHRALDAVREDFEVSPFNGIEGAGRRGVIAAGFAYGKLAPLLKEADEPPLRVLRLGTPNPLPERRIEGFLHSLDSVLVLEEMAPFVETQVGAIAQRVGLSLPILGRASGHVPEEGELSDADIVSALAALFPGWPWPPAQAVGRPMPSREPLCQDCPYILTFRALLAAMEPYG
ncbi:MAG: indolepyruvate ferredoxin oxidoreductase subunit alpha, partial [Anaerolineae bacterium]